MTKTEQREVRELLELAADIAYHKSTLDPDWTNWRKQLFWKEFDPVVTEYKARVKALTGFYVAV